MNNPATQPRSPDKSVFRVLAESQGVVRPFDILVRMPPQERYLIARLLGCRLRTVHPEAQAWRIINQNLRGLQARTHSWPEKLTPFSRNNTWWDIVTRAARRMGIHCYPGLPEEEVERLLFDRIAETLVQRHAPEERAVLDALPESCPELGQAIRSLRLSRNAARTVLSAIALSMAEADASVREGAVRMSQWLRDSISWSWRVSVAAGIRLLREGLSLAYRAWASRGLPSRLRGNFSRVWAALAMIHLHDMLERALEEFEVAGA